MTWPTKRLDELGLVSRGRSRHRPRNASHLYGGIFPFVQTADVKHSGLYITSHSQTYNNQGLAQSKLWPTGTLCITIAANIADTSILSYDACFPDSVIGFISQPDLADVRFVKYFMDTVQERYRLVAGGAAQDNLNQEKLLSFPVPAPAIDVQTRIADILSAYDDLIENNHHRMALLEEAIHLLYREWFVYLRFPGHERVKVVDGVPEGWTRATLKDVATLHYGKSLPKKVRREGLHPVYGSSGIVGTHVEALAPGPGLIVGRKGNVGTIFLSNVDFFPIDTVYYIAKEQTSLFLYASLSSLNFISSDAAVPGLNRDYAYSQKLLLPPVVLLEEYERYAGKLWQQITTLRAQNLRLREARDLLLPRLMNGSIAV